jgi:nucleoside-diphosphate-sugar epimerase
MPPEKTVYIFNGHNFVARSLTKKLLAQNNRVVLSDTPQEIDAIKISSFSKDKNFLNATSAEVIKTLKKLAGAAIIYFFPTHNPQEDDPNKLSQLLNLTINSKIRLVLVSKINVYQGIVATEDIKKYFGENQKSETKYSKIENCRYLESRVYYASKNAVSDVVIARLGEVFGYPMDFSTENPFSEMLQDLLDKNTIVVGGNGLNKHYPIYIDDAVEGLIQCGQEKSAISKIIPLANNTPIAEIELAYLLKGVANKKCQIKFLPPKTPPENRAEDPEITIKTPFPWKPHVSVRDGVKNTLIKFGYFDKTQVEEPDKTSYTEKFTLPKFFRWKKSVSVISTINESEGKESSQNKLLNIKRLSAIFLGILAFFTAFPVIYFLTNVVLGNCYSQIAKRNFNRQNFIASGSYYAKAKDAFYNTTAIPNSIKVLLITSRNEKALSHLENLTWGNYYLNQAEKYHSSVVATSLAILQNLSPNTKNQPVSEIEIKNATTASVFERYYRKSAINRLGLEAVPKGSIYKEGLEELFGNLGNLLGMSSPKSYLILVANQNEITPYGGSIETFADISVDKGKIVSFEIDDIKNVNAKLPASYKGSIPEFIEKLNQDAKPDIRNSLWGLNFRTGAKNFISDFGKVTRKEYNGVVVINTRLLQNIASLFGNIYMPPYNTTVSSNNVRELLLKIPNESVFGGTVNKSFLTELSYKIATNIMEQNLNPEKILDVVVDGFSKKNALAYLPENPFFENFNLAGTNLLTLPKDRVMIADTNIGATQANYFVERAVNYNVSVNTQTKSITATAIVSYFHKGQSNNWPAGPFINFTQIVAPKGAKLESAFMWGVDKTRKNDILQGVLISEERGATSFGTGFELKAQNTLNLELTYKIPETFFPKEKNLYPLTIVKQPGIDSENINVSVNNTFKKFVITEDTDISIPIF